jgi:hypothetical protein
MLLKFPFPAARRVSFETICRAFLIFSGLFIGACVGMVQFPSRGITTIVGSAAGCVPGVLLSLYYRSGPLRNILL